MLRLKRIKHNATTTIGLLFVDGNFECFTLEDEPRLQKVYGKTRIPKGTYAISLRQQGRMHGEYSERFGFHRGMLHLQNVPGFEYIYIHIGNSHEDTLGCILVGDGVTGNGLKLLNSTTAYKRLYQKIMEKEKLEIRIEDE